LETVVGVAWSREFEDPIDTGAGGELVTLRDAANFIMALPKRVSVEARWPLAMHLLEAAEDRRCRRAEQIGQMLTSAFANRLLAAAEEPPTAQ
jgi:hypothetical protein